MTEATAPYYAREPRSGGGGEYWIAEIEVAGGHYMAAEVYGDDKETVEARCAAILPALNPEALIPAPAPLGDAAWLDELERFAAAQRKYGIAFAADAAQGDPCEPENIADQKLADEHLRRADLIDRLLAIARAAGGGE